MTEPTTSQDNEAVDMVLEDRRLQMSCMYNPVALLYKNQSLQDRQEVMRFWEKNLVAAIAYWNYDVPPVKASMSAPAMDTSRTVILRGDLTAFLPTFRAFKELGVYSGADGWPALNRARPSAMPQPLLDFINNCEVTKSKYSLAFVLFGASYLFWNSSHPLAFGEKAHELILERLKLALRENQKRLTALQEQQP